MGVRAESGIFQRKKTIPRQLKSPLKRHAGESRGPEFIELTGFRLPPE
jgi:hypothetical protein